MQNVELGLRQREMALQSAGGSPTSDVRPGSAQAYAIPEHMPTKPFVTQATYSSNRLGYAPAYATQGACMFVKRRKVVNKSYLVTDQTTVRRRGLLCLSLEHVRRKRLEKRVELKNQLIGLHFSAYGCRCGFGKAGARRQKGPPVGEPPFPSPPLPPPPPKPPPRPPSVWRHRLWIAWSCV